MKLESRGKLVHVLTIDGWCPPSLNKLLQAHWSDALRIKRAAYAEIAVAKLLARPGVPDAAGRRRVGLAVTVAGPGGMPDPDNILKCLIDGLMHARLLVDDAAEFCEIGDVTVSRGKAKRTIITLEDIPWI